MSVKTFILSAYEKIAVPKSIQIQGVVYPNQSLVSGIFEDRLNSMTQVPLMTLKITQPEINTNIDTSHTYETGSGEIFIPNQKDFYFGEGVM